MPSLQVTIFNTLTRKKETLKPLKKGQIGLYTCGPTVYNYVHIGNFRTYIFQDMLKRTLEHSGLKVTHVMNVTDVDDKTIKGARESGQKLSELTIFYEKAFLTDLEKLNIVPPTKLVRATEHIGDMVELIKKLLARKIAYERGGSTYFRIAKFKSYGRLARLDKKNLKPGARVDVDEYTKDQAEDFVLWKRKKNKEPSWKTSLGEGRPGWHIECSAMAAKYLGTPLDIHSGGVDLIFPHHENEIAQTEAALDKKFVNYWIHGEHLLVNGKKMAKSFKNFYTLRDLETRGLNPLAFRYMTLNSHYRSKLNFTWGSLAAAAKALNRLYDFVEILTTGNGVRPDIKGANKLLTVHHKRFTDAMLYDLNTPKAVAVIWQLMHSYYQNPRSFDRKEILDFLYKADKILGLNLRKAKKVKTPAGILKLVAMREKYRKDKKWEEADKVREKVQNTGYTIEDTPEGPVAREIKLFHT